MAIVATMLSGNSETIVADAVRSAIDWVDLFLLIDTGITDGTVEIVQELAGAKYRRHELAWCNDFAGARNLSLEQAAALRGKWALTVDTDERFEFPAFSSPEQLRAKLNSDTEALAWLVSEKGGAYAKERFIRVPTHLAWKGRTHEALIGATAQQRRHLDGVYFHEFPKTPEQHRGKLERDLEILTTETREKPNNARWWFYLGQTYEGLGEHAEAVDAYRQCWMKDGWAEEAAWACFKAATCLRQLGQLRESVEVCAIGLTKEASFPELAWHAGYSCYELGRYSDALCWSQMAIALGAFEGTDAGRGRIGFRNLTGWYEGPYDVMRFTYRSLGQTEAAEEAEQKFNAAIARRSGIQIAAPVQPTIPGGEPAVPSDPVTPVANRGAKVRVAVLGLYSSGSSATAGMLHHLGVHIGKEFSTDYFEPVWLSGQLRRWWDEPELRETVHKDERVRELVRWMDGMEADGATAVAAKHPLLVLCAEDLREAWGEQTNFIWCRRPLEESIASLQRRGWFAGRERVLQEALWQAAATFFAGQPHLKIEFADTLKSPEHQVERIIDFLGISPTSEQRLKAIKSIRVGNEGQRLPQSPIVDILPKATTARRVFLDLGTHYGEGLRAIRAKIALDESWEIHAYEPNPECRPGERLGDFDLPVTLHEAAIWTRDGQIRLLQDNHRLSGSGSPNDGSSDVDGWASCLAGVRTRHPGLNTSIDVRCEDLSRVLAAYSPEDFIVVKMDIEGAEFAVLRHLIKQGTITRIRELYIEWHDRFLATENAQSRIELERTIRDLGVVVLPWG